MAGASRKAYSVFIGAHAIDRNKELINPNGRSGSIPPEETLISCKYDVELNIAGSCEFVVPPTHPYYSDIIPMTTEVIIAEIDNIVWFGRVTDTRLDWNRRMTVHCEGALAYLNDSIQPYEEIYGMTMSAYLTKILTTHNEQVPQNRRVYLGQAHNIVGKSVRRTHNYDSTMDVLQDFLSEFGGYLYCLMGQNGDATLFWLEDRDLTSSQSVQYGHNLLELESAIDYSDICTAIIPVGEDVEMVVPDVDENGAQIYEDSDGYQNVNEYGISLGSNSTYATASQKIIEVPLNLAMEVDQNVEPDEDGITPLRFKMSQGATTVSMIVAGANSATYGNIVRRVKFNNVWDTTSLRAKATEWLAEQELGGIEIDISAADLRFLDASLGNFYLGMAVPITSVPHHIEETLVITRINADIMKVSKKITLGRLPKKTLSDIAGRGQNNAEVGMRVRKISSINQVSAKSNAILFIPA